MNDQPKDDHEEKAGTMQMTFQRTAISGPDSEITAQHLQETLSDFIDLTLQAKQAHWNVVGPRFRALHLQLDQLVGHTRRFSDAIAERIVILGQPAHGSAANTDAHSKLDPLPATFIKDDDVVKLFVDRLDGASGRLRERIGVLRDRDPVAEGLLIDALGALEEQMWMLHAQMQ